MKQGWPAKLKEYKARLFSYASAKPSKTAASKAEGARDTFCILAWNHLQIAPNGTIKMCCIAGEDIHEDDRTMSLYTDSYDGIWNSKYMRDARRGMAMGEKISPCARCYREEDAVGQSRRTVQNAAWLANSPLSQQELVESARANDWRVPQLPTFLQLNMGNLCNLACRMCSSQYSSKIEHDPVHSKWMPAAYPDVARWSGDKLQIGPRPFFGVNYTGFHPYEGGSNVRWSSGKGTITFAIPEGTAIRSLGLSLRLIEDGTKGTIRVNELDVFDGEFSREWQREFDLPGVGNHSTLEIEIECSSALVQGRKLGACLVDAWVRRDMAGRSASNERALMRYSANQGWWARSEVMFGEIMREADQLRYIIFQGGEPFLVKEFDDILDTLIENGSASSVTFEIVSNLTIIKDSTLSKLANLKKILLGASIDGIGPILEYIRYPAIWTEIETNLQRVATLSNVDISFNTAVQAYNLLDVVNIFSYCDKKGFDVHTHFLVGPYHLNVAVLPKNIRAAAIEQVTAYLAGDNVRPANRSSAEYVVKFLQEHLNTQFRNQFASFVQFTNDMDRSRKQSFRTVYPDLIEAFAKDGLKWTNETRFASVPPAA